MKCCWGKMDMCILIIKLHKGYVNQWYLGTNVWNPIIFQSGSNPILGVHPNSHEFGYRDHPNSHEFGYGDHPNSHEFGYGNVAEFVRIRPQLRLLSITASY